MKRIFKYQLTNDGFQTIQMPLGAQILSVVMQRGVITLYAIIEDTEIMEPREFAVWGTGWCIEDDLDDFKFLATLEHDAFGVSLVWHVFEKLAPAEPMKNGGCPVCGGVLKMTNPDELPFESKCGTCGFHGIEEEDGSTFIELGGKKYSFPSDGDVSTLEATYIELLKMGQKVLGDLE